MGLSNSKQIRIAISGKSRSGKDTLADAIKAEFKRQGKTVIPLAFADGIKEIYKQNFRYVKTDCKPREAYITIGEAFRAVDENVWVERLKGRVEESYQWDVVIVTDLRRKNEEEYLKDDGFTTILVDASDDIRIARAKALGEHLEASNAGDDEVDLLTPDITIHNDNDVRDWSAPAQRIVEQIREVATINGYQRTKN